MFYYDNLRQPLNQIQLNLSKPRLNQGLIVTGKELKGLILIG